MRVRVRVGVKVGVSVRVRVRVRIGARVGVGVILTCSEPTRTRRPPYAQSATRDHEDR